MDANATNKHLKKVAVKDIFLLLTLWCSGYVNLVQATATLIDIFNSIYSFGSRSLGLELDSQVKLRVKLSSSSTFIIYICIFHQKQSKCPQL